MGAFLVIGMGIVAELIISRIPGAVPDGIFLAEVDGMRTVNQLLGDPGAQLSQNLGG